MDTNILLLFVISIVALGGFFITKTKGFGRYATSSFLLLLVVIFSAFFFAIGKIDVQIMVNIFFAVIGFAGGLVVKKDNAQNSAKKIENTSG